MCPLSRIPKTFDTRKRAVVSLIYEDGVMPESVKRLFIIDNAITMFLNNICLRAGYLLTSDAKAYRNP